MGQVTFRNIQQAVLFEAELKGQISDGMWENSRGDWRPSCDAEVFFSAAAVGKNFHARNYNFSSSMLLDCVGDRMLFYAKAAKFFHACNITDIKKISAVASVMEWKLNFDEKKYTDYTKKALGECGIFHGNYNIIREGICAVPYDMRMLKKDLNDMEKIWKGDK